MSQAARICFRRRELWYWGMSAFPTRARELGTCGLTVRSALKAWSGKNTGVRGKLFGDVGFKVHSVLKKLMRSCLSWVDK